jgi:AraC-like DNA-binding protein
VYYCDLSIREALKYAMQEFKSLHYYLPVNDDALRWGVYLTGIGRAVCAPGRPYPSADHPRLYQFRWENGRTLPECAVVVITEGQGVFESEMTGVVSAPAGSTFVLPPGVWHRYRPSVKTGWTEHWFCLSGELVHRLVEQHFLRFEKYVRPAHNAAVLARSIDDLMETIHRDPIKNPILLSMHALGLLATVIESTVGPDLPSADASMPSSKSSLDPIVARSIALIWTLGHQAISVDEIAKAVGVSRRTLQRHFLENVGHSIVQEIIGCRLSRAKRLLMETNVPIKVAAFLAGFSSEERMRVSFLQREGVSPTEFRRHRRR